MVRLKDIAEACGVSVATVSRALNGVTRGDKDRTGFICQTAKEMGYYPNAAARTLKTSRSNNIGILYEDRMNHEYFSSLLDELRTYADYRGYDLTLIGHGRGEEAGNYYEHARRRNLDGVIVIQADFDSSNVIRLATSAIPAVIIDHLYEGCDCVASDNQASMERIIQYAWNRGHRKIALIQGETGAVSRERLSGFYKTCAELGIRVMDGYVRDGRFHDPDTCARIIRQLMSCGDPPTCILCPDDYSCLGAVWALKDDGIRVPGDVSLIGYDGIRISQMVPPRLTTYRQNAEKIAEETVNLLLEAIEDPDGHVPRQITVEGSLIEGETVKTEA